MAHSTTEGLLHPRVGGLYMVGSITCFSINALLLHHMAEHRAISPWVSMMTRCTLGLVITMVLFQPRGELAWNRMFRSRLLLSRGVLGAVGTATYYLTVGPLGAGKATLIGNTWCVFACLFAAYSLGERLTAWKLLSMLLALVGIGLLTEVSLLDLSHLGRYELLALFGAFAAAAVVVVIRQLTNTETSATIFASQCVYGGLIVAPLALRDIAQVHGTDWGWLTGAAVAATAGQLCMTQGFRYLTVTLGSAWQMLVPLVITLSSVALFAEPFSAAQAVGAVITLAGCAFTLRK